MGFLYSERLSQTLPDISCPFGPAARAGFPCSDTMKVLETLLLVLALAGPSWSVSPADCEVAGPKAGQILNLINEKRRDGYLFQLLRVADAHTDVHKEESTVVHYLVLDVIQSDCSVLSRTRWEDCPPTGSRRPSETVIGKCKVIAVTHSNTSWGQELDKVLEFNCTTSSVASVLASLNPGPVITDYFEDPEQYKGQAEKALKQYKDTDASASSFQVVKVERALRSRGGERTNLYMDFSIGNHSKEAGLPPFSRSCPVFGFCQADFGYNAENSDLNNPDHITVDCEIFNVEDARNFSEGRHRHWHHGHFGRCGPPRGPPHGPPPHGPPPHECQEHPHHHHSREHRGPPLTQQSSMEEKEPKERPNDSPVKDESELQKPQGTHPPIGHIEFYDNYRFGFRGHGPQKPCPLGQDACKHGPHGHGPHGHCPHGRSHGHGPHGHGPHKHGPHSHGPCGHGPPPGPPEEHDSHRPFPFHRRGPGSVNQLPPLKEGEVIPLPEISIPCRGPGPHPGHHHPRRPEIQPFPETPSESCPGKLKDEYPQLLPFL
ncbi:histidine-rich glycoprotein [Dromiciops gliroides]|uniref:histidine-rich glycoprotein n=1 Tax=Dromiciops gliroides TaxID=33562 RepID=UPI001CC76332|nr:histidine-rich glycoprotein [Dromiciops gliroides]